MIVINERKWAESILETGQLGDNVGLAAAVLARYFYHVEGLKHKKIFDKLNDLFSQLITDYNPVAWENLLDKVSLRAKKRPLIEIERIPVNKGELSRIEELKLPRLRRLAFTMVVVAKYFDMINQSNNHWINLAWKDLFKMACISMPVIEQADSYRALIDAGIIEFSKKVGNTNARVLILDDTDPELYVDDLRAVGHRYQQYIGEPYFKCERCGVLTRQNKCGNKKYCADCAKKQVGMRHYKCIDCGRDMFVVSRNSSMIRCPECQKRARALANKENQRRHREALSSSV